MPTSDAHRPESDDGQPYHRNRHAMANMQRLHFLFLISPLSQPFHLLIISVKMETDNSKMLYLLQRLKMDYDDKHHNPPQAPTLESRNDIINRVKHRRARLLEGKPPAPLDDTEYEWRVVGQPKWYSSTSIEQLERSSQSCFSKLKYDSQILPVNIQDMMAPKVHKVPPASRNNFVTSADATFVGEILDMPHYICTRLVRVIMVDFCFRKLSLFSSPSSVCRGCCGRYSWHRLSPHDR
jgi:hypothetical protein